MPTNGKTQIAADVEFNCIAREWRCKWSEDNDMASLKACVKLLDELKIEVLGNVHEWIGKQASTHEVQNGNIDTSKQTVQRIICTDCHDFKVITKLPMEKFSEWEKKNFSPEEKFLEGLRAIDGVSAVETQTYTLENVNIMCGSKVKVPKAASGCMAEGLPRAG
mmetsp:Transcript_37141/g.115380  ORF Transcript_37141/g.115380 Transcript_37141/m.115380 type:complete len:164 (-) Transcript_37141:155-646(-)